MALFLADENFPFPIVRELRALGHDVEVLNRDERSASDLELLTRARAQARILLTQDKDFASLVVQRRLVAFGIVHLSARNKGGWRERAEPLAALIAGAADRLSGSFSVLTEEGITHQALDGGQQSSA
ncbi:MAG: DUF5615 family PIN-like protein [Alphaproteobacteria bacterium]|nr:DUF5615 family PIN-like protein [Alphaproteobacteria bacterium]